MKVRLGTRAGGVARAQSEHVTGQLREFARERGEELEISIVPVTADADRGTSAWVGLDQTGVLVAALRVALISGECDLVVHEMKDVPDRQPGDLDMAAVLARGESREALCTNGADLEDLDVGARIASASPRAAAQVANMRPDFEATVAHGDPNQQLERLYDGECEALVIPRATLEWLKREAAAVRTFDVEEVVPAPGQGALGVEIRGDADEALRELVAGLDHPGTRVAVRAEAALASVLYAPSTAPFGAHATTEGDLFTLHARVTNRTGTLALNEYATSVWAEAETFGRTAGLALLGRGAARLLRS